MKLIQIVIVCLLMATAFAQEQAQVPPDVTYKTAPDAVNEEAKAALVKAFAGDKALTKQVTADVMTCGPMLWQAIKSDADKSMIEAKKVTAVIGVPTPRAVEGRMFAADNERQSFWRTLIRKYPALNGGRIRKANAWELSYFWSTVPFDSIQEPFFAIEAGPNTFIVNLRALDGKPVLFWIDLVSDFQKLQTEDAKN